MKCLFQATIPNVAIQHKIEKQTLYIASEEYNMFQFNCLQNGRTSTMNTDDRIIGNVNIFPFPNSQELRYIKNWKEQAYIVVQWKYVHSISLSYFTKGKNNSFRFSRTF